MHRLFVALAPSEPVRDALIDTMEALDGARWVDEENLHLTLRFVGEVEAHTARDLADSLARVSFRPFEVALAGVGHFARKGVVQAIWAGGVPSRPLLELHGAVKRAAVRVGLPPDRRAFVPHVTIARLNRSSAPIGDWLARNGTFKERWQADSFALIESHLGRHGAAHEVVAQYPAAPSRE